jgi:SAM-dependent methyltransferase
MTLIISEREIRSNGPGLILGVCWRQWRTERGLARRGVLFRSTTLAQVARAYGAMTQAEFDRVNGRQDWANWRTIPRALSGHVPDRPLRVLDLGCGTGSSTQVLAHYCPAGSHITGYEIARPLLAFAPRRSYRHRSGTAAQVDFVGQGVTEPLRDARGDLIPATSVDVINASGVVGHHLNRETIKPLLAEIQRVGKNDAAVLLDVGPTLRGRHLRRVMIDAGFACLGHYRSWLGDLTGEMVFRRAPVEAPRAERVAFA